MADPDEDSITAAALESVAGAITPRARRLSEALIRHLHGFVREVEPTQDEWAAGIEFLTRTGHMSDDVRQEFILLSDTLGVSMLVDAINNRLPSGSTPTTVFGPFYVPPPLFENGSEIHGDLSGTPLYICGSVSSVSGEPIEGAAVDIWHCDAEGFYDLQRLDERPGLTARGRFHTDREGAFRLWSVRPTSYPIPTDGPVGDMLKAQGRHAYRPEHVHFLIEAPGHLKLITHLFAAGDDKLGSDVVFGVKESLIQSYEHHDGGIAPDGRPMTGPWVTLHHAFRLANDGPRL